jgi:hypothetical protein
MSPGAGNEERPDTMRATTIAVDGYSYEISQQGAVRQIVVIEVQVGSGGEVPGVVAQHPPDRLPRHAAPEHDRRGRVPERMQPHRPFDPGTLACRADDSLQVLAGDRVTVSTAEGEGRILCRGEALPEPLRQARRQRHLTGDPYCLFVAHAESTRANRAATGLGYDWSRCSASAASPARRRQIPILGSWVSERT